MNQRGWRKAEEAKRKKKKLKKYGGHNESMILSSEICNALKRIKETEKNEVLMRPPAIYD